MWMPVVLSTIRLSRHGPKVSAQNLRYRYRADGVEVDKQGAFRHYPTVRASGVGESACRGTNSAANHGDTDHAAEQSTYWRTPGRVRAKPTITARLGRDPPRPSLVSGSRRREPCQHLFHCRIDLRGDLLRSVPEHAGGLGLGLSICRSIIEAHEGRLWASANEPRGAVFQFTLPASGRRLEEFEPSPQSPPA